jgi:hypothetical protein
MGLKKRVINDTLNNLKREIYTCLDNFQEDEITERIRSRILSVIDFSLKNNLGVEEYERFCKYLISKELLITINSQDNVIYVNFYDGLIFYSIEEVINEYFNIKIKEVNKI